jgi:phosphoribosylformimino-5-aminoimidazole carboxamide ribotide isomerase
MVNASAFHILPAIDLRGGRVVRLRRGDFDRETAYDADPVHVAVGFALAGARWIHVVDLDGARTGVPAHGQVIAAIVEAVGGLTRVEVAGGLRDERAVSDALEAGAARVVIGTTALKDPAFAGRLVGAYGSGRVAVAIDVRDGKAVGQGWTIDAATVDPAVAIERLADAGVEAFEVTAIDRDGLLGGPDLALYERVVRLDLGAVIASGGISTIDDLRALRRTGCTGAIIGRALYEGRFTLDDAIAMSTDRRSTR